MQGVAGMAFPWSGSESLEENKAEAWIHQSSLFYPLGMAPTPYPILQWTL